MQVPMLILSRSNANLVSKIALQCTHCSQGMQNIVCLSPSIDDNDNNTPLPTQYAPFHIVDKKICSRRSSSPEEWMWCSISEGNWKRVCTWRKRTITNASGSVQSKELLPLPHFHAQPHTPRSKDPFQALWPAPSLLPPPPPRSPSPQPPPSKTQVENKLGETICNRGKNSTWRQEREGYQLTRVPSWMTKCSFPLGSSSASS